LPRGLAVKATGQLRQCPPTIANDNACRSTLGILLDDNSASPAPHRIRYELMPIFFLATAHRYKHITRCDQTRVTANLPYLHVDQTAHSGLRQCFEQLLKYQS
jgi:hypothetical protein